MGIFDPIFRRRPRPPSYQTLISRKIGKMIAGAILAGGAALFGLRSKTSTQGLTQAQQKNESIQVEKTAENYTVLKAIKNSTPLKYVTLKNAQVIKLLRNDTKGAKHQRWIIQIEDGVTITVIYNLDLAEKVPLSTGDTIEVAGELVFGDRRKDPIIHWTHADPQKKHIDGYVILNGHRYGELTGP